MRNLLLRLLSRAFAFPGRALGHAYLLWLHTHRNISLGRHTRFVGLPLIDIRPGASLRIGDNVVLNSQNRGYHLNLHSPVKLFADREGASITIGKNTRIHGACIHAWKAIEIGSNCLIAANSQIVDSNGHDLSFDDIANRINTKGQARPIVIHDNVWLCANSIVLPGVTSGAGSVISANSVVADDIPAMSLARGNPAKVVKDAQGYA